MAPKKHVVIIGGGGAGARLARTLSSQLDSAKYSLTLISAHPYMVFYIAALRMLVTDEGSLENRMLIPYDKLFVNGNGTFKQGLVTAIEQEKGSETGGRVHLESGESLDYDVLVLSSGSKWGSFLDIPFDEEKTREHIREWRDKFSSAKSIVIGGGGAVAVELAGELRHYYPNTKVTIVQGDNMLLNKAYPDKFRNDVMRRVRAQGVNLILDDYIDSFPASATRKGTRLDADLVIPALGGRPNTSWIESSLGDDVTNKQGFVRIEPTLQLPSYPNIFAIGDIIEFPEQKQLGKVAAHADVVAANIRSYFDNAQPKKTYKGQSEMIVITVGKTGGAGFFDILWGVMFGNWFTYLIKSKGLLIPMQRKSLGYTD